MRAVDTFGTAGFREEFFSDSRRIRVKGRKDRVLNRASALRVAHKNTELSTKPLGPVPARERPPAAATLRAGRTPPALPPACPPRSGLSVCRASRVACHQQAPRRTPPLDGYPESYSDSQPSRLRPPGLLWCR